LGDCPEHDVVPAQNHVARKSQRIPAITRSLNR
jgi:hypothetical protein